MVLLFGGAWYALRQDWDDPLFGNGWFHLITAVIGGIVLLFAFHAAANGGRELAKGREGDIPRLETNRLVTSGIYGCMRHPMLFGLTLLPLGWGLLLGSPTFVTKVAPLEMLFIIVMVILFEEMEVRRKFGSAYEVYAKEVPMVSFKHICLSMLFKSIKQDEQDV
jgi:protein-S-isoprenylcysteine O-methyltransferase Ste14